MLGHIVTLLVGVGLVLAGAWTLFDPRAIYALSHHNQPKTQQLYRRIGLRIPDSTYEQERQIFRWLMPPFLLLLGVGFILTSVAKL